ncbi:PREDICTED: organic cation transporter protein-like isoform X2 [Papilio polytes]|uniref:organic cation transporter protein-like isoform X2 n=1 Tax=Papilio polytes TaxID=76194 RepID=UPI000675F0BF|nr:PREDICTED: organic cation transporter protein-like isoform X2 [Papilio polytes]
MTAKNTIDLDHILTEVGEFGPYQLKVLSLVSVAVIFSALYNSQYIFAVSDVHYRCMVPQCETWPAQVTPGAWGAWALTEDRCSRMQPLTDTCTATSFHPTKTERCDRFVYEHNNTIVAEFNLGCQEWKRTLVGTIHSAGIFVALPLTAYVSDTFGRRVAFIMTAVCPGMVGLARSFTQDYISYLCLEFLDAVVGAGVYSSGFVLALEMVGINKRVLCGNIISSTFAIGQALIALIAWGVPYWRTLTRIMYAPSPFFIIYYFLIEESVRWLLSNGKKKRAAKIIFKAAKVNKKKLSPETMRLLTEDTPVEIKQHYPVKPNAEKTDPEKPSVVNSKTEKPSAVNSNTEKPSAVKSDTEKPSASKSETEEPSASKSETEKPSESKSETEKPSASKSDTEKPSESKSETEKPSASKSETEKPSDSKSDTEKPSASKSDTEKPSATKSDTEKPSASKSETEKPSAVKSDSEKPSASKSDTEKPSATKSDTEKPSAVKSDTEKPSSVKSDTEKKSPANSDPEKMSGDKKHRKSVVLAVIRSRVLMSRLCICAFWWVTVTFIYYGLSINSVSLAGNSYVNYILTSLIEIPGYALSVVTLDRFGRKKSIITAYFVCGISLLALPFIPSTMVWLQTSLNLFGKLCISMVFSSIYVYTGELYPTGLRHRMLAACSMTGRIGQMIAPQTPLLMAYMESLPYILFGLMAGTSGLLMLLTPETLRVELPDTIEQAENIASVKQRVVVIE